MLVSPRPFTDHLDGRTTSVTDPLAMGFLLARVAQSSTHLICKDSCTSSKIRSALCLTQFGIAGYWILKLFDVL